MVGVSDVTDEELALLSNEQPPKKNEGTSRRTEFVVFVIAILNAVHTTIIMPTCLIYLQRLGLASKTDVSFYVLITSMRIGIPVGTNSALGALASRIGTPRALSFSCFLVAIGELGMCVVRGRAAYIAVFSAFSLAYSCRTLRTALLTASVPSHRRTVVLSYHALMSEVGWLMGPLVWLACERYPNNVHIIGTLWFNKFTLSFICAAFISFLMAAIALLAEDNDPMSNVRNASSSTNVDITHVQLSDGRRVDTNRYRRDTLIFFCVLSMFVQCSFAIIGESFQPIIVNHFGGSGRHLGIIYEAVALVSLGPPLIVAALSRFLQDRIILLIGLLLKVLGFMLFLPLFGRTKEWQVILGFTLQVKATIFFYTSSMSLFTKLLGGMSSAALIGILTSAYAGSFALTQFMLGVKVISLFDSASFVIFGIPILLAVAILIWPNNWKKLNPEREFVRELLHNYDLRQS